MGRISMDKRILMAIESVGKEIRDNGAGGGYAAALAGEGYAGGYRDALGDLLNLRNGTMPDRRRYWESQPPLKSKGTK